MAEFSIGAALGEGFGLIRRRPISVVVWGLVQIAVTGGAIGLLAPFYTSMFTQIVAAAQAGAQAGPPNIAGLQQMQGLTYLFDLVSFFVTTVLYCAVFRAVLQPERWQFAYLRVGAAEFFLFIMMVAAYFAFVLGAFVVVLPVGIVVGILVATHAIAAAVIAGIVGGIVAIAALIYLALRFSMIGPMTVSDGKIHFLDAWHLTKGKVGRLFMIALCLLVIVLVGEIIVGAILVAIGAGVLSGEAGGLANLPVLFRQSPQAILSDLVPLLAIAAIVFIPLYGCMFAVMGAPWARAYRDLVGPDLAATFS